MISRCKHEPDNVIKDRIVDMDLDVLAVQEVENIDILKEFNRDKLGSLYKHVVLIGQGKKFELWDEAHWTQCRDRWLAEETVGDEGLPAELQSLAL